jgi:hypothetical protein
VSKTIFTNNAIKKIADFGLSEDLVLEVFNKGESEKWKGFTVSSKKYPNYEVRVFWKRNPDGKFVIISVNKRERR